MEISNLELALLWIRIRDLLDTVNIRIKGVVYQYENDAVLRPDDNIEDAEKMTGMCVFVHKIFLITFEFSFS